MFTGFDYIIERLQSFEDELQIHAAEIMASDEITTDIVNFNKEQLDAGERSDGSRITPEYRPFTVRVKRVKGQPTDRVTLHDTGDFYSQLRVKTEPGKSEVYDTDYKSPELEAKYNSGGAVIFGLSETNIDKLRAIILPQIISFRNYYFQ